MRDSPLPLAVRSSCRVVIPFYGLAPERPFPCALSDGEFVLSALDGTEPLVIGGDSAGGNIAAVLARRWAANLQGVILISPWLDLRLQADSYERNAESDSVFSKQAAKSAAELYLQGELPDDPDVSPLCGDLTAMPPTFITVGSGEVLIDDSLHFVKMLAHKHRKVSLHVMPGMTHVEPVLKSDSPHTQAVLSLADAFIQSVME